MTTTDETPMPDEAMITAYVLGEMSAEEASAFERRLEEDPALRREAAAIRATTMLLASELSAESAPGLTPAHREAIEAGADPDEADPVVYSFVTARKVWGGVGLAAAACLAVVMILPAFQTARSRVVTMDMAPPEAEKAVEAMTARSEPAGPVTTTRFGDVADLDAMSAADAPGEAPVAGVSELGAALVPDDGRAALGLGRKLEEGTMQDELASGSTVEIKDSLFRQQSEERELSQEQLRRSDAIVAERLGQLDDKAGKGIAGRGRPAPTASAPPPARAKPSDPYARASKDTRGGGVALDNTGDVRRKAPAKKRRALGSGGAFGLGGGGRVGGDAVRDREDGPQRSGGRARELNREAYAPLVDNDFKRPLEEPLSTFSIDVDTASYANARRFITAGTLPPKDSVRIEELINSFDYAYDAPTGDDPFSVNVETGPCPWNDEHRLVRLGLQGRHVDRDMRPATNLVFLLDVSGSMNHPNKLPLVRASMRLLVQALTADDRVAIVVYAGASGLVLPSTFCDERQAILAALDRLKAGGSTNGGEGLELAYAVAQESFIEGGVNRVILCTDGDFNVGVSSEGELVRLIEEKRESGVDLSVLGFGTGNFQDARMEALSNKGNGNFAYIDTLDEARRVLVERMAGTLVTIAKDVKFQVEFNPAQVGAYRLIGYANRLLAAEDFNDDRKDAGEIGAGHTVTALYEIAPPGAAEARPAVDPLVFQEQPEPTPLADSDDILMVKLRYKRPGEDTSTLITRAVQDEGAGLDETSADFRFAAAVASFGMVLRESPHRGTATFASVLDLASTGVRSWTEGAEADEAADDGVTALRLAPDARRADAYRQEFVGLVEKAKAIAGE
jgi:Ca-activated chloride channel family protein